MTLQSEVISDYPGIDILLDSSRHPSGPRKERHLPTIYLVLGSKVRVCCLSVPRVHQRNNPCDGIWEDLEWFDCIHHFISKLLSIHDG